MIISEKLVWLLGNFFSKKVKQFRSGQLAVFDKITEFSKDNSPRIWMHVSSLGEYEQGLPVLEKLREKFPDYKIILTFFSPSGYEIKKDNAPVDCVVYLPIDNTKNVQKFLDIIQPKMVFFVKYDFWPNYLFALHQRNIKTYLISGLFTPHHKFFKRYNTWLKKSLRAFNHFFVQDKKSEDALLQQGFKNISIVGDTRFDRVYTIAQNADKLDFVHRFKAGKKLVIGGSTWQQGEAFFTQFINHTHQKVKFLIAPHLVDEQHIQNVLSGISKKVIRFSEIDKNTKLEQYVVLILDTIGLLNKAYRYADVVYIGGGFGKSIHNIQEPAVFGVPIITGPKIHKFNEAVALQELGGLLVVHNRQEFSKTLDNLLQNDSFRTGKSKITKNFALASVGATDKIIDYLIRHND